MPDFEGITQNLMAALRQLENTSSTGEKRRLIAQYLKEQPEFKRVLTLALDPYIKFGINKFPNGAGKHDGTNTWYDAYSFLENAARRDMPQSSLITYLIQVAENMNSNTRELFRRVLLKDLRCGVGATLVNSVVPGLIPQFSCQLATLLEEHHVKKLQAYLDSGTRVFGQPKLNGDRAVTICPDIDTAPEMLSRKGFVLNNYRRIADAFHRLQVMAHREGIVFDGEVIMGDFFQTRTVKKLAGNEAEGATLYVFDCVEYDQWRAGSTDVFSIRQKLLRSLAKHPLWEQCGVLVRVPTMPLTDVSWEGLNTLRDQLLAAKYEGLIIRPDLPYDFSAGARSNMYKHKKMDTMDCVIQEVLLGEEGKKHAHHAGSIMVELPNGQLCKAGLRLDDAARDKLWNLRGRYVGLVAEISYQDKTVNQSGEWKLQFPVFTGNVRKDKS